MEGTYIGQKIRYGQSLVFAGRKLGVTHTNYTKPRGQGEANARFANSCEGYVSVGWLLQPMSGAPKRTLHGS